MAESTVAVKNGLFSGMKGLKIKDSISAYSMISPFFVLVLLLQLYVFATGLMTSFTDAQVLDKGVFIGLKNYGEVLTNIEFWRAFRVTFIFAMGSIVTQIPIAFLLAYFLNFFPIPKLKAVLRSAFFLPCLINVVVIALLFRMLFNPDQGVINWVLGMIGIHENYNWLMDSNLAVPLLIIVAFWQWTGYHMVYFLAQLQTISPELYEAAKIDGASLFSQLFHITLPQLRHAFTFVIITSAIGGFQMFDLVFLLFPNAQYGPNGVARTLIAYIYDEGFSQQFRLGYSSAIGWITFIIIMLFSLFQLKFIGLGKNDE